MDGATVLPVRSRLAVQVQERNAAWWHSLAVVVPESRTLQGAGYLFPGPPFEVGPYDPGLVVLEVKAYNPRAPHQFFGLAAFRVTGSYPSWTVSFEDGSDGDFNDIIVSVTAFDAPAATLEITCVPASVMRGNPVDCTATSGAEANIVVKEWSFSGTNGLTAGEMSGVNPWSGPLVTGGTVTVKADVDGMETTATTSVSVTARNWAGVTPSFTVAESSPGPLPGNPTVIGDFGKIGFRPVATSQAAAVAQVPSGPNVGMNYLRRIPYGIEATVHVNTVALSQGVRSG